MAKILIVDDSSFMRISLKSIVDKAGHEVVGMAKNGAEAIEMYSKLKPDIVTMDVLMQEMDGITALKKIMIEAPGAKIIMVTSLCLDEPEDEAMRFGACGYIRKPFNPAEIIEAFNKVLGK